ncbi:MAG: hypothetical protein IJE77_07115, partial [Thermoguttaceae bacterium]|nr:hypothetical protein [Thermoguttaceae bacterium]
RWKIHGDVRRLQRCAQQLLHQLINQKTRRCFGQTLMGNESAFGILVSNALCFSYETFPMSWQKKGALD